MKWLCFFMIWNKRRLIIYSGKTLNLRVPQYLKLLLFSINSDDYPLKRKISSAERGKYRKLDTCSVWLIAELSAWERFLMRKWTQFQKENPKKKFSASVRTLEQTLWVRMSTCKPEFFKTFFCRKLWWSSLHYSKIYLAMLSSRGILKTNNGREGVKCKLFCPRGLRNRVARPQTTSAKKATHFWLPLYYSRAEKKIDATDRHTLERGCVKKSQPGRRAAERKLRAGGNSEHNFQIGCGRKQPFVVSAVHGPPVYRSRVAN